MKTLKDKAIDIHGKKYVLVKDRVLAFNELYPEGSITTKLLSKPEDKLVVVKATVSIGDRKFTGHSQAEVGGTGVNATAALENAETSAVGRALAMLGIGVLDSIASVDEINKASPRAFSEATLAQTPDSKDNEFSKSTCDKCGGRIAISKSGNPYCTNRCWLPENKHLQTT